MIYLKIFFVLLIATAALSVWWQKEVVKAAFSFLVVMLGVAGILVLEGADFIAAVHLVIYIGGIVVLLLFGMMFVHRISSQKILSDKQYQYAGISLAVLLIWIFGSAILAFAIPDNKSPLDTQSSTLDDISRLFLTDYVLLFELGGILLTIALLGVAVLVGREVE